MFRIWPFSEADHGHAVQALLDPGDSSVSHCCGTFLCNSVMLILLNASSPFQAEVLAEGFLSQAVYDITSLAHDY
jgi:pyrrolidone-carboxylate peptidase